MADVRSPFKIGDKLILNDISFAPEGAWLVRETMQFLRAEDGKSIISITPVEGSAFPVEKVQEKFTLIYAGPPQVEKSFALKGVFNSL